LADWYTKETKAVVQITEIGYDETYRKTLEDIRSSDPQYDIFIIWYPELGDLIRNKALLDLTDWIEENKETIQPQDFIPRIYDAYTLQKGRRWALPFDGDTHVLFYRKSILSKHNLNPPETWDDYLNVSRTITEKEKVNGIYGTAIMSYKAPILILSSFLNRVGGYGGQLLTKDGRPSLDTPEVKMALESLLEQAEYALPSPLETSFEVSRDSFLSGRVAMVEQWTDIGVMAEDNSESTIRGDWGAIQMPKGSGKNAQHAPALNAGFALAISSKAPNLEVAKDFLLFAVRPDIMAKYNVLNGGTDPTRISILKSDDYRKFAPEVSAAAEAALFNATPWPNIPGSRKLMQILSDNIVLALRKKISVENAISDTQKRWTEIIDSTN
ncbi:MAG TPA: sugar ABC transporter substrate-binding protein, partial [Leptospiraceae bacterium]|nr:sugar ABC transporter substrate-binding protein [Leptospiraceae bacterium]